MQAQEFATVEFRGFSQDAEFWFDQSRRAYQKLITTESIEGPFAVNVAFRLVAECYQDQYPWLSYYSKQDVGSKERDYAEQFIQRFAKKGDEDKAQAFNDWLGGTRTTDALLEVIDLKQSAVDLAGGYICSYTLAYLLLNMVDSQAAEQWFNNEIELSFGNSRIHFARHFSVEEIDTNSLQAPVVIFSPDAVGLRGTASKLDLSLGESFSILDIWTLYRENQFPNIYYIEGYPQWESIQLVDLINALRKWFKNYDEEPQYWLLIDGAVNFNQIEALERILTIKDMSSKLWISLSGEADRYPQDSHAQNNTEQFLDTFAYLISRWTEDGDAPDPVAAGTDNPEVGSDQLDQERVAHALAWLGSMRTVEPPLCIGVLGAWGSGKSFMMRMMREELVNQNKHVSNALRDELIDDIHIIRFNAWTYAKTDLWSALLYEILNSLDSGKSLQFEKQQKEWKRKQKQEELDQLNDQYEKMNDAYQEKFKQSQTNVQMMQSELERMEKSEFGIQAFLQFVNSLLLFQDKRFKKVSAVLWFGVFLVLLASTFLLLPDMWQSVISDKFMKASAFVTGLVGVLTQYLTTTKGYLENANEKVSDVRKKMEDAIDEFNKLKKNITEPFAVDEQDKDQDLKAIEEVEAKISEVKGELKDAEQEIRAVSGELSEDYETFLRKRLGDQQYQADMGPLYQVQMDLQLIARYAQHAKVKGGCAPQRIFLFIDDLDRCQPDKVVRVLEAVQLLLASNEEFEADPYKKETRSNPFVVVLGADTRILTRALEVSYDRILLQDKRPSGLDYLEKIIQLPYWIPPIDEVGYERYVTSLTGVPYPTDEQEQMVEAPLGEAPKPLSSSNQIRSLKINIEPHELIITDDMKWFKAFRVLAASNARAIKRLVNQYRLCKVVALGRTQQPFYASETMFLLCIADGFRACTRLLMRAIEQHRDEDLSVDQFFDRLGNELKSASLKAEIAHLLVALEEVAQQGIAIPTIAQLSNAAPGVLPFCFIGDLGRVSSQDVSFEDFEAVGQVVVAV